MPPYEIHVDAARAIVLAVAHGKIDPQMAVAMVVEARRRAAAEGMNILYDMRDANPGDMSSGALFWMPRQVAELKGAEARRIRAALLHHPEYAAMAAYWETAFSNAGLRVRAFAEDEAGAVAWLAEA